MSDFPPSVFAPMRAMTSIVPRSRVEREYQFDNGFGLLVTNDNAPFSEMFYYESGTSPRNGIVESHFFLPNECPD